MNLPAESEQRSRVAEFQRKHRVGLLTLLFTDIVGSTKLKQDLGDREAVMMIQQHHDIVRTILGGFKEGQEISTSGDSFFLVFAKPSEAVKFSLLLQAQLRALGQQHSQPISDRIGIHVGEVFVEEWEGAKKAVDLYGIQVDASARVMSLAQGGQILMTRFAFDNARQVLRGQDIEGVGQLSWLNHGKFLLKGVEEHLEICEVGEEGIAPLAPPPNSEKCARELSPGEEPVLGWRPAVDQLVPNTKWMLKEKLGEGGFGEVWLGVHEVLKKQRVFKFCFRADRMRSLKREVAFFRVLIEKVGDHPNIVGVEDIYCDEPPYYIVMSYAEGKDLVAWAKKLGGLDNIPLAERLEVVAQVADGLEAAHSAGVIHRDIKPSNILIAADRSDNDRVLVKLTDFGIGQAVSEDVLKGITIEDASHTMVASNSTTQSGTYMYMPPELVGGKSATTKSDIYSLGVVLYQMIVGDLTRALGADWPEEINCPVLRGDLKRCFSRNPEDRFSAAELSLILRSYDERKAAFDSDQTTFITRNPEAPSSSSTIFLNRSGAAAARFEPFKFSNGAMARNIPEFKELCRSNLAEVAARLRDGTVENWLRHCEDEAEAVRAQQIRESAGEDWEAALEEFLTGTRPFIFRTGETVTTLEEWFAYAQKNQGEARFQLYTENLAHWLRYRGWTDWAEAAADIRAAQTDRDAGLREFLQRREDQLAAQALEEQFRGEKEELRKRCRQHRIGLMVQAVLATVLAAAAGWFAQSEFGWTLVTVHPSPFQWASPLAGAAAGGCVFLLGGFAWLAHQFRWRRRWKQQDLPVGIKSSEAAREFSSAWRGETWRTFLPVFFLAALFPAITFAANRHYGDIFKQRLERARVAGARLVPADLPRRTNSLGMVFVKVPGAGAQFSIWETRRRDYAAFAQENPATGAEWNKDYSRAGDSPDLPVSKVAWADAQAFCQWLTRKEVTDGLLRAGDAYRLPTDLEWSAAAGLPAETGDTPKSRGGKTADEYPWGQAWPPPLGAGNLLDTYAYNGASEGIPGYSDGQGYIAPVGSFAPNRFGIYDLEGNVSEWCEDWFDKDRQERVIRGGNMFEAEAEQLLSSVRNSGSPTNTAATVGFRVVLVEAGDSAAGR